MSRQKLRLLIVAAYPKELVPLCRLEKKHFIIKNNIAYLAAGIGPVAAAFGLTHFLEDYRPERIFGTGTAGIINPKLRIGDVVTGKMVSAGAKRQQKKSTFCPDCPLCPSCPELTPVAIYAPQEITKGEKARQQLCATGYDVENLEAYAFAFVAKKFKIPFTSILGLTNFVGPQGHAEWVRNEVLVCGKMAREVKRLLP